MRSLTLARAIGTGVLGLMTCINAPAQVDTPIYSDPAAARTAETPVVAAVPVPARSLQTAIEIDAVVLEIDRKHVVDFKFKLDDDQKHLKLSNGMIAVIPDSAREAIVNSLVRSKNAKVISRPRIITIEGKEANVQVGGVVKVPFGENGKDVEHEVGLKLKVLPTMKGTKLMLDIECEYSRLNGKDRIDAQTIDSMYEVSSGDTIVFSGFGDKQLVLFLTPKKVPASDALSSAIPMRIQKRIVAKPNPPSPVISRRTDSQMANAHPVRATVSRPAPLTLEEALRRIFPTEQLEVIYLPNAVVLSGAVSEKRLPGILTIAEQYSSTVISNLSVKSSGNVAETSSEPLKKIGGQLERIRNDVLMLRKEVTKLSELLQSKPAVSQTSGTGELQSFPWAVPKAQVVDDLWPMLKR